MTGEYSRAPFPASRVGDIRNRPLIELRNVTFSAQQADVVTNFSAAFAQGKATAITGASGAGKSTVLKLAAGLLVPAAGTVLYNGADISKMSRAANLSFRRESAFVFQDSALWANQTIRQILELPLSLHYPNYSQAARADMIKDAIDAVRYTRELDIRPDCLSMGEQKLIAFARAILCKPQLLFLDEWTESLDNDSAQRLINLAHQYKIEGKTLIFVSHSSDIVHALADTTLEVQANSCPV